jgi:hypothetical protein
MTWAIPAQPGEGRCAMLEKRKVVSGASSARQCGRLSDIRTATARASGSSAAASASRVRA